MFFLYVVLEAPRFTERLDSVHVKQGSKASFTCQIDGVPEPRVVWYHGFREVYDGRKTQIDKDGSQHHLVVKDVTKQDMGDIECRASNKAGHATCTAQLIVNVPPRINLHPRFHKTLTFSRGDTMKLKVPIEAYPRPRVTWCRDQEVVESGDRVTIQLREWYTALIVADVEKGDAGRYTLSVENDLGVDQTSISVFVIDHPDPPQDKPEIIEVHHDSVTLKWQEPIQDGGSVIINYVVEKREIGTSDWLFVSATRYTKYTIRRLLENVEYEFRVRAENLYGLGEPSQPSDSVLTQEPKLDHRYDSMVIRDHNIYRTVDIDFLRQDPLVKYIIHEQLGSGAFGTVHRAVEKLTNRTWAA
ncbi:unnamed protein product, partial [Owenia fusiformis]